jgi:uncharacterized membrane protein YczE
VEFPHREVFMKYKNYMVRCLFALTAIFFVGMGAAFNAMAGLGNDSVGIFYDGIRAAMGLTQTQLGVASNVVNIGLVIILIIIGRKYINVGTIIHMLSYGTFVSIGTKIYSLLFAGQELWTRILASFFGCLFIYVGVAIFIVVDIGLDPMTGMAMVLKDKLKWEFRKAKILFDTSLILLGFLLGGKIGVITVIAALIAGPSIQFISERIMELQKQVGNRLSKINAS